MTSATRFHTPICFIILSALQLCSVGLILADQMPQDYWFDNRESFAVQGVEGVVIDSNGTIYLGNGTNINRYQQDGTFLGAFGSFTDIDGMTFDQSGNLYVLDQNYVKIFDKNQNLINSFNAPITTTGGHDRIAIDNKTNIYLADANSSSIVKVDRNGNKLLAFGGRGNGLGQFSSGPLHVLVNKDDQIIATGITQPGSWSTFIEIIKYDSAGNFVNSKTIDGFDAYEGYPMDTYSCCISKDGYLYINTKSGWSSSIIGGVFFDSLLNQENLFTKNQSPFQGSLGGCFSPIGDLYLMDGDTLSVFRRKYYNFDSGLADKPPLQPVVQSMQRSGTTYLDIDYKVIAAPNTPMKVGMLAFVNGQTNLNSVIIPKTFVEGSGTNLGVNIPPNTTKRVTWDMLKDWSTNAGTVQIEILANDGRPLQPQMWTNNPTNLPAKLTGTVTDAWSMWLWLLATKDSRVTLVNGTVQGNSGNYYGQTLYGITATNQNYIGSTNQIYTNSDGSTWTNWISLYATNYTYRNTTNGQQFLQEIVDSQAPLIR
jgi:hypothetical protein